MFSKGKNTCWCNETCRPLQKIIIDEFYYYNQLIFKGNPGFQGKKGDRGDSGPRGADGLQGLPG